MEQMRDFDFVSFEHDVLVALGGLAADAMSGLPVTVIGGLIGTQTSTPSLSVNLTPGRIYQFSVADAVAVGSIPQDLGIIVQQGYNPAQTLTLIAPSSGQSQWNLIQAQFSQSDAVRANDPNGGIVPFYNAANPTQPTLNSINTVRKGLCILQVVTGSAATTGSEVPPNPTTGWVPLYLIDLAGGQTQITTSQIIATGPSVGTGVSSSYPVAPFLAGLLASHHGGTPGQAPKIRLSNAAEVQGILPYANMSAVRTLLNANLTLYVNASTGADTNSGTSPSAPFKTIQAAANAIQHNYDWNGYTPTISVANGLYTAGVLFSGALLGTQASTQLIGNISAPQNVTINVPGGNCISATATAQVNVQGFTLTATGVSGVSGNCLVAQSSSAIGMSAIIFGAAGSNHLWSLSASIISLTGTLAYQINGGAAYHFAADSSSQVYITNGAVTLTGTPAFSSAFATAIRGGIVNTIGLSSTTSFTGAATGLRYIVSTNGIITSNGTTFPGSVAGTVATGGQYT